MAMARFDVEFTKDGQVFDAQQVEGLLDGLEGATDLLVLAHGWNNDLAEARVLFGDLGAHLDKLLDLRGHPSAPGTLAGLAGRTFTACHAFWPSKKFADDDLIPGGGAASATAANDDALLRALARLADDPARLGEPASSPDRDALAARARALVPRLDESADARRDYVTALRALLDPNHGSADDGSDEFFTLDADALFEQLDGAVTPPLPAGGGGAAAAGTGGAAGLGDLLRGTRAAARRLANYATYYQMKARAGTVGASGLAPVLRRVRERHPDIRLHLVGHSFGGRLVTAAAGGLGDGTPAVTMTLLQAAFSHFALSGDFGGGREGFYRKVVSNARVSGPIVITHTKNDRAVGIAYPLASRVARQNAAALGGADDPYGGMGRNGAQRTVEAAGHSQTLGGVGRDYGFAPGRIHNLLADEFIKDHGDVTGIQVAYVILAAAAAV